MAKVTLLGRMREQRAEAEPLRGEKRVPGGEHTRLAPDKFDEAKRAKPVVLDHRSFAETYGHANSLKISSSLMAKHGSLLAAHVNLLDQVRTRIDKLPDGQRQAMERVPSSVLEALVPNLGHLQEDQRSRAVSGTLTALAQLAAEPRALTDAHVDVLRSLAHGASKLSTAELGSAFGRSTQLLATEDRPEVLHAVRLAMESHADRLVGAWMGDAGAHGFALATDVALHAAGGNEAVPGLVDAAAQKAAVDIEPRQRELLAGLGEEARQQVAATRERSAEVGQQVAQAQAQLQESMARETPEIQRRFAELTTSADRQLSPDAKLLWYQSLDKIEVPVSQAPRLGDVTLGVAALHLDILSGSTAPEAAPLAQVSQQFVALMAATGLTAEQLRPLSHQLVHSAPFDQLPGCLAQTTALLTELRQAGRPLPEPAAIAALGESLVGNTDALAPANGARQLFVQAFTAAPTDAARDYVAREGIPFALAAFKSEPGPAHDLELAQLAPDLTALAQAQVPLRAILTAYPTLPADALPRLLEIGLQRGEPMDAWVATLARAFKAVGKNKEGVRNVRSLLMLADHAGADAPRLLDALVAVKAPPKRQGLVLQRTAAAMLHDTNFQINVPQVDKAIADLQRGADVAGEIEARLHAAMTQQLGLNNLLAGGVKPTEHGVEMVQTKLKAFFANGANNPAINQEMFKGLLASVLEDRYQDFRFTLPPTTKQLDGLTPTQQKQWKTSQTMNHVRFDPAGQAAFDGRVRYAAQIGKGLLDGFTEAWGPLDDVRAKQHQGVEALRALDKNDPARRELYSQVGADTRKLEALSWAHDLAHLTPETTTPLQFVRFADRRMTRMRPAIGDDAFEALVGALKIDDLSFSEVTTNDGPDLDIVFRLGSTNCLGGWPAKTDVLAYAIDANKRMIVTKNQAANERRAMVRLVDRQDPGHEGEQMLVLERTYPDNTPEEEKQRIIEHTLRRATEMGIAAAYPTEYYWNASTTQRRLLDMNRVIEDLNRRYHTTSEEKVARVKNRAGNLPIEYIDSAPPNGAGGAGVVGVRRYPGNADHIYENKFMILSPKKE